MDHGRRFTGGQSDHKHHAFLKTIKADISRKYTPSLRGRLGLIGLVVLGAGRAGPDLNGLARAKHIAYELASRPKTLLD